MKIIDEKNLNNKNFTKTKISIIASRFNPLLVDMLLEGAKQCLLENGIKDDNITLIRVAGAMEIPYVCKLLLIKNKNMGNTMLNQLTTNGILALGAVIRGETSHYDIVINSFYNNMDKLSLKNNYFHNPAIIAGVLSVENKDQGIERADIKKRNKGYYYAHTLLETIILKEHMDRGGYPEPEPKTKKPYRL